MSDTSMILARILLVLTVCFAGVTSCTDESIAFDEPVLSLADSAGGFLGYVSIDAKQSFCGNCHGDEHSKWVASRHAAAWASLQASGSAAPACEGCHTVSERGNALASAAGYSVVPNGSFHDVQCESCHGPGLEHITAPELYLPSASIAAGTDLTNGCGECHGAAGNPSLIDWSDSHHASPSSFAADRDDCAECHEGKAALLDKFGETADYLEKSDTTTLMPITCAVCHDPHGSEHDKQLRASITEGSLNHLCVRCHNRRAEPPDSRGPHAAQGPLVLGLDVGWIAPTFNTSLAKTSTHALATENERICVTCHVVAFDDGSADIHSTGHTFRAAACLDASGSPTEGPCENSERDFRTCVDSNCHISESAALDRFDWLESTLHDLLDAIWIDDNSDGVLDATDSGLLPQVVAMGDATQLDLTDQTVTAAEGALWNAQLAHTAERPWFGDGEVFGEEFSAHRTSGNGVHNGFLLIRLLTASIEALEDQYGLSAGPSTRAARGTTR